MYLNQAHSPKLFSTQFHELVSLPKKTQFWSYLDIKKESDDYCNASDSVASQGGNEKFSFQSIASIVCQSRGGAVCLNLQSCQHPGSKNIRCKILALRLPLWPWQCPRCHCDRAPQERHSCICSPGPDLQTPRLWINFNFQMKGIIMDHWSSPDGFNHLMFVIQIV